MLVAIVGTDRNEVECDPHCMRDRAWVSIRLARTGSDFSAIDVSISIEVARKLVTLLPDAIKDAEQLAAQPAADASDA